MKLPRLIATFILLTASLAAEVTLPITKDALTEALRAGRATPAELVHFVKLRGVDFQPTASDESDLKKVGASVELLAALKENFRILGPIAPASAKIPSMKPLTKTELLTLLQVGTPGDRIAELAKQRGLAFRISPGVAAELRDAGADQKLLGKLSKVAIPGTPAARPSKAPVYQRALIDPVSSLSLDGVRNLFVESDLIRAEIAIQLDGRITVVTDKVQADGILLTSGVLFDRTGTRVLWSDIGSLESDPKKAAELLVSRLKRALTR